MLIGPVPLSQLAPHPGVTGLATVTDGVSLTDIASNSGSVQTINIDMVQEVTANNSSYGAEYAKGPAVISADSKRGGAAFHGAAYLVARNTDLNSNDWYDNYLRQSRPAGSYYFPGGNFERKPAQSVDRHP